MRPFHLLSGVFFAVGITVVGCGGSDGGPVYAQGSAGGACYPNGTCNAGLACAGSVCVASTTDAGSDGSASDAGGSDGNVSDGGGPDARNDAGLPCPGATINHPSDNETRGVNTSVPFVGVARDATCAPITGQNLAWDDNGNPIGTGTAFNYSFTTKGTRTITLTATDGAAKYKATITLNIN